MNTGVLANKSTSIAPIASSNYKSALLNIVPDTFSIFFLLTFYLYCEQIKHHITTT